MTILYQPLNGYCYNSDTIFLYDFISRCDIRGDVLEVGSGCGVLGILLKRDFDINLFQIEIQKRMFFLTQINTKNNNIPATLYHEDFLNYETDKKFDFLVSNPPFYHSNVMKSENEMINIARYSDHLPLREFLKKCSNILKPRGELIFCYDSRQLHDIFCFAKETFLTVEIVQFVYSKIDKKSNLVFIKAKKNSKSLLSVLPPFVVFDEDGNYKSEVQQIFKRANTYTIKCEI